MLFFFKLYKYKYKKYILYYFTLQGTPGFTLQYSYN